MAGPHSASPLILPSREDSWEGERLLEGCIFTPSLCNCLQFPWVHSKGPAPQFSWLLYIYLFLCPICSSCEWFSCQTFEEIFSLPGSRITMPNHPPVFSLLLGLNFLHSTYIFYLFYLSIFLLIANACAALAMYQTLL